MTTPTAESRAFWSRFGVLRDAAENIRRDMRAGRKEEGRIDPNHRASLLRQANELKSSYEAFINEAASRQSDLTFVQGPFKNLCDSIGRFMEATGERAVAVAVAAAEAAAAERIRAKEAELEAARKEAEAAAAENARRTAEQERQVAVARATADEARRHAAAAAAAAEALADASSETAPPLPLPGVLTTPEKEPDAWIES